MNAAVISPGRGCGPALRPAYLGPDLAEAKQMELRAREAGLSLARSKVLGQVASFRDGWVFRRRLAAVVGVSVRTVQRALTQGRSEGLIQTARAKLGEKPPAAKGTFACGWSHRWVIGRGLAGAKLLAAIASAKLAALVRSAKPPAAQPPQAPRERPKRPEQHRRWTADELDAALERERERPPPE